MHKPAVSLTAFTAVQPLPHDPSLDLLHQQVHHGPQPAALAQVGPLRQAGARGPVLQEAAAVHHLKVRSGANRGPRGARERGQSAQIREETEQGWWGRWEWRVWRLWCGHRHGSAEQSGKP